ncbi:NAD(P)H:quinone oxidoreductase [Flavobacterium sp. FlaQc-52]|jgi:NAD(P)H dehydrogenase (quinone)|uniref:NAD(P)H:quinone oxidoreductase n=1 Tax=Flavobacterium cupriresistens TaxID=2893885 RepID=A0ABU4REE8_9FLAO|nr:MULTISPECIES: NAD(P)H:quinone oxidoreductase [unclassified Flavobacterium]MDX6190964.1 NAD(P)H:quinone oxidoreductase [Flavobacterium sp. Fl-318]UFH43864.1 NAD(P)H:quinone oxidoreductase [Flavobacterium sp. F-323]
MKKQLLVLLTAIFIGFGVNAQVKTTETTVLVLIHSQNGGTYKMAKAIAEGIQDYPNSKAILKRVPSINSKEKLNADVEKLPVATIEELVNYDGIAFGSPVHFANISAEMNSFFSQSIPLWTSRALEGKPATVFMSAGSGAGKEAAILSFWNILASHGMIIVPTGIMGTATLDKTVPQGNTPFGATSLAGSTGTRPSPSELNLAKEQGKALARAASGLKNTESAKILKTTSVESKVGFDINKTLKDNNITLPEAPKPVGNYVPFTISDHKVYINQVALKDGKILNPGKIGATVTDEQAKEATYQTMLNVIAVLKEACGGDLNKVKQCVQLTGYFNTTPEYTQHAAIMNSASNLTALVFGEKGKHARATIGAFSLPINSAVEIQAVFEIE